MCSWERWVRGGGPELTIFQTLTPRLSCPPSLTGSTLFPTLMAHKMWNKREIEGERGRRLCACVCVGCGQSLRPRNGRLRLPSFLPSFLPNSLTSVLHSTGHTFRTRTRLLGLSPQPTVQLRHDEAPSADPSHKTTILFS